MCCARLERRPVVNQPSVAAYSFLAAQLQGGSRVIRRRVMEMSVALSMIPVAAAGVSPCVAACPDVLPSTAVTLAPTLPRVQQPRALLDARDAQQPCVAAHAASVDVQCGSSAAHPSGEDEAAHECLERVS